MKAEDFVAALGEENQRQLASLGEKSSAGDAPEDLAIAGLLKVALKNEFEAAELAAAWMQSTPELDARLALARQCGDEAKHYKWIEERLREMGHGLADFNPMQETRSPLFQYLLTLTSTVERAAAGQFTRESVAIVRNEVFATFCEQRGDLETAKLYRDKIQPDEQHHHVLGHRLLLEYATTEETQTKARLAARETLRIADELQELAKLKGICRLPGC